MSDIPSSDVKKPLEQPEHDLSNAMGQLTVTTDNSRKSSPSLSDMPIDAVALIIEKLNYKHKLKLRRVSKSLLSLVDKLKPACKHIGVGFWPESSKRITITSSDHHVIYANHKQDHPRDGILIVRDDFEKVAFGDLASSLKNPKLQLENLSVCSEDLSVRFSDSRKKDMEKYCSEIRNVIKSLNHQVSVKEIYLGRLSPSCLLSILPYLKPGVLENISLEEFDLKNHSNEMDQVVLQPQWKQAKELILWSCFDGFPMKHATHFKRFCIYKDVLDGDDFNRIKDFLSKLDDFEECIVQCWTFADDPELVYEVLGAPVSSNATKEIFHQSIPDPDYYFEYTFSTENDNIKNVKKKRESS